MQTLSQQGFCQPPEGDDNDKGGEVEVDAAGVGIGDGSGTDDISKEIEDESQIEGLQGDDTENKEREGKQEDEDAIEMNDDFGGALEDVPDADSGDDAGSDVDNDNDKPELDETLGDLDDLDTSAVDEKMWGDEKGPEDSKNSEDQTNQDHSKKQNDSSEVVGKEGKQQTQAEKKQPEESGNDDLEGKDESGAEENEDEGSNDPNVSGAPMNDQVPDANTLDLPEDIDVSGDDVDMSDESVADGDTGMEQEDDGMAEENQPTDGTTPDAMDDSQVPDNALESRESVSEVVNDEGKEGEHADDEVSREEIVAPPEISEGVGMTDSTESNHNEPRDETTTGELGASAAGRQGRVSTLPDHEKFAEDNK
jgi:midasin